MEQVLNTDTILTPPHFTDQDTEAQRAEVICFSHHQVATNFGKTRTQVS